MKPLLEKRNKTRNPKTRLKPKNKIRSIVISNGVRSIVISYTPALISARNRLAHFLSDTGIFNLFDAYLVEFGNGPLGGHHTRFLYVEMCPM